MSSSGKGSFARDSKLTTLKPTSLNPHAAEFVPFSLQSSSRIVSSADASPKGATSASVTLGKAVLDQSESSASNNSGAIK
ncbi:hypothetical protein LIER_19890 [Lithospermum erythrorhizon]|uniref:Uncharacterized protein n=1 Tax=Lithospermum erythrorhizon TaxID=34254 RepID=A0AAV3QN45_LITER